MSLPPGTKLGPYEIISAAGAGGMGEVYKARDTKLKRDVAIKVLPDEFASDSKRLARFKHEAQTLASLNHPNIAQIYGVEESNDVHALVMELVIGDDLSQRMGRGAVTLKEALPIAKQIAFALEASHAKGIIHRDLKPGNIKVCADGTVKVLDFGLAKTMISANAMSANAANSSTVSFATQEGVIVGTAAYMSPEQATGDPVDERSDLWAFGVVLLEMLSGKPVFTGETVSHVFASILTSQPDWTLPTNTPPVIRNLLRRCLEKDRKQRHDSAALARIEIEEALTAPSGDAMGVTEPRSSWSRALPWVLTGTLGIALFTVYLLWPPKPEQAKLTRVTLALSSANSLTIGGGTAISPDGRTVVFVARAISGTSIYVRKLDELEPRALPLTDGARGPFFSPDGRWIAFLRRDNLEKMPISGGPAQIVCQRRSVSGGRWRPDGMIIFGQWPDAGLWQVSSDGGEPRLISKPSGGNGVQRYRTPEPLPGDKGIVFTIFQEGRNSIAVLAPGSDKPRIIIESGSHPRYLSTGHLLYIADNHLFAVAFDVEHLQVRGTATVVVDDVNNGTADYDVSANGTLVYMTSTSPTAYNIVWKDRHGVSAPIVTQHRPYGSLVLSPDGEHFSVSISDGSSQNIWTGGIANQPLTRLTFGNDDYFGLWSRDGKRLFYTAGQNGSYNIFAIPTDGSGKAERVTQSPDPQKATSISPNGDTLLLNDIVTSTGEDIWELSLSRKESKPLIRTQFNEGAAVFSPDGHWIAYESDESGQVEIYVVAYPGPGSKRRVSLDGGTLPLWGHTGRELFYQTDSAMFAIPILDRNNLRLGTPVRLFAQTNSSTASISLNDQRFLMLERVEANKSFTRLNLVENWFEDLKTRVPTK
ncbi:MAG: hypothetical protein JWO20_1386 [Candidatus Angelobacter sp.]|jgi:serine/threonine protein kinase/Tol biopolymer transport system component|nr:hypothetical protein [Candidatus Angelobacter sp.]